MSKKTENANRRIVNANVNAKVEKSLSDLIGDDLDAIINRKLQIEIEKAARNEEIRSQNTVEAAIKRGKQSAKRAFKARYKGQLEALDLESEKLLEALEAELASKA